MGRRHGRDGSAGPDAGRMRIRSPGGQWRHQRRHRTRHADHHDLRHLRLRRPVRASTRTTTRTSPSRRRTSTPAATPAPTPSRRSPPAPASATSSPSKRAGSAPSWRSPTSSSTSRTTASTTARPTGSTGSTRRRTDPDGRVIGYGTDIGPQGLCFNGPLFDSGRPAERPRGRGRTPRRRRRDLGGLLRRSASSTTTPPARRGSTTRGFVWNSMVNQLPEGYYTADGELNVEGNADLKERFDLLGTGGRRRPVGRPGAWDWNGGKAFVDGTFATFVCPGWMLGVVRATPRPAAATPPPAGTSPTSSRAAPPTGAARSSRSPRRRAQGGRSRARRLADPARAAGRAVRGGRHLPEHRRGPETAVTGERAERVLQRRTGRRDPRRPRAGRRRPVQGPGRLRDPGERLRPAPAESLDEGDHADAGVGRGARPAERTGRLSRQCLRRSP